MSDILLTFILSFCVVLMAVLTSLIIINHIYVGAYGIRYVNPKHTHQEQDNSVEEPANTVKRHDNFRNRISDINNKLQISMNDKCVLDERGDSPEKTHESELDEHVAPLVKPDEHGLYDVDENAKFPSMYDQSDVEIITPEYERLIDEYITTGRAVRHE